jgi:hypothetical protein
MEKNVRETGVNSPERPRLIVDYSANAATVN